MATLGTNGRRVAIVAGVRTPFAKAGTALKDFSAIELGKLAVAELVQRANLDGKLVEAIVYGTVVPSVIEPNIAREIALLPMLPRGTDAYTVGRACASANQAITDAADQIVLGHHDVVIAGGAESLSNVPILHSRAMSQKLVAFSRARSAGRAQASGPHTRRHGPRRDARGFRRAGALQLEGVRLAGVGGARRLHDARRRGRCRALERDGWIDLDRPPLRRNGRTDPNDARQRAAPPRRRVRAHDGVRGGRDGARHGRREKGLGYPLFHALSHRHSRFRRRHPHARRTSHPGQPVEAW